MQTGASDSSRRPLWPPIPSYPLVVVRRHLRRRKPLLVGGGGYGRYFIFSEEGTLLTDELQSAFPNDELVVDVTQTERVLADHFRRANALWDRDELLRREEEEELEQ